MRVRRGEAEWRRILQQVEESGLTGAAYCAQKGQTGTPVQSRGAAVYLSDHKDKRTGTLLSHRAVDSVIPGSSADVSFLVGLLIDKFKGCQMSNIRPGR